MPPSISSVSRRRGPDTYRKLAIPALAPLLAALLAVPSLPAQRHGAPTPDTREARAARLDSLARAFHASSGAPGVAVAVLHGRDTLLLAGYGTAQLDHVVPVHARTVFRTGSVTKQVTAALVLQLVEEGRLALGDRIGDHLPTLPVAWHDVTVQQLLDHTSGIPSYTDLGRRWEARWGDPLPPDSLLALTAAEPMWFAPGTQWRYDNAGYVVLGLLLERQRGLPWARLVEERVTGPLRLTTLRPCDDGAVVPHRAAGYEPAAAPDVRGAVGGVVPAPYLDLSHAYAAGALCATAGDLARWSLALAGGAVVSPATYRRMTTPVGAAAPWRYGHGLTVDTIAGRAAVYHGGDIPGFTAATFLLPDDSLSVAVLANRSNAHAEALARDLARVAVGLPPERAPDAVALRAADRRVATGRYTLQMPGRGMPFALVARGDVLQLVPDGGPALPLTFFGRQTEPDARETVLLFGADFDARFRLALRLRGSRVIGGHVLQGGGRFEVVRQP